MAQWNYTLKWGKQLREAICAEDEEFVVRCLIACYRELLNKLSDEDKEWKQFDIEEEIFCLENFDEEEDIDDYLECFYDICDDVRAWIAI
jgi:hypothetical protein